jgi:hypothetical protein
MAERKLRIVRYAPPFSGVCERCAFRFEAKSGNWILAMEEIKAAFDAHKCLLPLDSSQNALRVVREATENKSLLLCPKPLLDRHEMLIFQHSERFVVVLNH